MWGENKRKGSEMNLKQAAEMALQYFDDAHGLEDTEVAIKEALRQALAQPERKWVGLTDEESLDLVFDSKITEPNDEPIKFGAPSRQCIQNLISHVEAKLREKNQ